MSVTYKPISALSALAEASIEGDDLAVVVDVHDVTQAPSGSTKKITLSDLRTALLAGSNGAFAADAVLKLNTQSYNWPASQVANGFLKTDGSGNLTWVSEHSAISLANLSDVTLTSPASPQFLGYSGSVWVNRAIVTADVSDLTSAATGITSVGTIATGVWNATAITWAKVDKTGSSLADLITRSAADLTSGALAYARLPTGNGSWDTGVGTTITITRALTVSGTLTGTLVGSADKWTTARNLAGNSVDGSANVAFANKFVVQGTADAGLSAAQFLGALGTGILKNTTTTGVLSIAVAGDFPTLNQNTSGSAATLTTPRAINGVNFDGSAPITVTAAAGTLTGTTLNATVVTSSLTAIGTLASGAVPASLVTAGTFGAGAYTFPSTLTVSSDIVNAVHRQGTSDGSDNGSLTLAGGGAGGNTRGGTITLSGNEAGSTGSIAIAAGNVTGGQLTWETGGSIRSRMTFGGIFCINNGVTNAASAGDVVLGYGNTIRSCNQAATTTVSLFSYSDTADNGFANMVLIGGGIAGSTYSNIRGNAAASLPTGAAAGNGMIAIDTTNNRLCYYSGGNRYYLAGTSF